MVFHKIWWKGWAKEACRKLSVFYMHFDVLFS